MARKSLLLLALTALAAAATSACNLEIITDNPAAEGETITLTCTIADDTDSKVDISEAGKVTWEPGDMILVHGQGEKNKAVVTLGAGDISADGKSATIIVTGVTPYDRTADGVTSNLYAAYPADAVTDVDLWWYATFNETNHMLMAGYNNGNTMQFRNLCGIFSFTVSGDYDSYVFSGNNEETVGYGTYEVKLVYSGGKESANYSHDTKDPMTSISGPVVSDGSTLNYIYIPLGAKLTKGFTIKLMKGGVVKKTARTEKALEIARNKMIRLGSLDAYLETPGQEDEVHNLSVKGTANCYVASAAGDYKFRLVRGNTSTSVGSVASAAVIWETWCNGETVTPGSVVTNVKVEDNCIRFSIPDNFHPGNALIAAKDASGKILWSWHIWVPETMFTAEEHDFSAAPKMMSRNLGALVDTGTSGTADSRSFGLLYQWGRKDPFFGTKAVGSTESVTYAGTGMNVASGTMTLDVSAANPTTLASVNGAWYPENDNLLWGDLERDSNAAKAVSDPCPPDYRLPARSKYAIFTSNGSTLNGFGYDSTNGFVKIGDPSAVFPICGYLNYDGNYSAGSSFVWNTRNDKESEKLAYCMLISGGDTKKNQQVRANAGSVRCVRETADPFTNAEGMPVIGSYTKYVFGSNVEELSGLCFSKDKDFIWGVGDEGAIYKISLDFKTVTTHLSTGSDLEDVTLNPNTGDLYFAKEADRVDKCVAPGYSSKQVAFYVEAAANFGNSGLEGIAYYTKDNTLYVGSQSGANLWKYKLDGTLVWNKKLGTIAADIQEVGGLCYDAEKDWLWVTDSEACKLFVFNGEVTKLLAVYDVSAVGNAESVLVDRAHSCVYVGDDGSSSKIYTYKFTNL